MKKIISIFAITLCACSGGDEKKQMSKSDSIAKVMDSIAANDTLLMQLKNETNN